MTATNVSALSIAFIFAMSLVGCKKASRITDYTFHYSETLEIRVGGIAVGQTNAPIRVDLLQSAAKEASTPELGELIMDDPKSDSTYWVSLTGFDLGFVDSSGSAVSMEVDGLHDFEDGGSVTVDLRKNEG